MPVKVLKFGLPLPQTPMTPTDKAATAEDTLDQLLRISLPTIGEVDGREFMALAMKLKMEIRSLGAEHRRMKRTLIDISKMQAEDNFKSWKDKVNDVQTWQEQFFNEVILKPVNDYAKEVLASLTLRP